MISIVINELWRRIAATINAIRDYEAIMAVLEKLDWHSIEADDEADE